MTKDKLGDSLKESIEVYGDGIRETLEDMGVAPEDWDTVWGLDSDDFEDDPELQWMLGWFSGVCEVFDTTPEKLITLSPKKRKTKAKKTKARKAKARVMAEAS